jgi:hypothetical protein
MPYKVKGSSVFKANGKLVRKYKSAEVAKKMKKVFENFDKIRKNKK